MTWTEKTGLSSKQLTGIIISIITLIGGLGLSVTNPGLAEYWFKSQAEVQKLIINDYITAYIDQGLGGSPYQTEKSYRYIVNNLTVGGTVYTYALDGITGKLWAWSTNKHTLLGWIMGNATVGTVFLKEVNYDNTVLIPPNVVMIQQLNGVESRRDAADVTYYTNGNGWTNSTNGSFSSLYVNIDIYANVDGSVQNYTDWIETEIAAVGSMTLTVPTTDHTGAGIKFSGTVGENVTAGQVLYIKSDGKYWKSNATANTTMPIVALATATITANNAGVLLTTGFFKDNSWSWNVGGLIYGSTTSGALSQTQPTNSGEQVQVIGYAYSATVIYFNPSYVLVELT